ncbi:MAG: hypothetical protein ABRQ24_11395, partial [Syntrophomonadaceae bacterium]
GNIHHAYLFTGPGGTGKKTIARVFAEAIILSDDPQGESYIKEGVHPDFMNIERLEEKTQIGIEQINRAMEPWLALKPYRAAHRVVIINDAHLLSLPAANALLKTLEEPPAYAVIILVADDHMWLETIVSRCQGLRFGLLSERDLGDFLQQRGLDGERASYLARLAQGCLSTAIQLADTDLLEQQWHKALELISQLAAGNEFEVFNCAQEMEKQPEIMTILLTTLIRDVYIYQSTHRSELLVVRENTSEYEAFKHLNGKRVLDSLVRIEELRNKYRGPIRSLLLSINISYQLRDALQ